MHFFWIPLRAVYFSSCHTQKKIFDMTFLFDGKYIRTDKLFYLKKLPSATWWCKGCPTGVSVSASKCTFFGFLWEQYIFLLVRLKTKKGNRECGFWHDLLLQVYIFIIGRLSRQLADARGAELNFSSWIFNRSKMHLFWIPLRAVYFSSCHTQNQIFDIKKKYLTSKKNFCQASKPFYHKILSRQLADARGAELNF